MSRLRLLLVATLLLVGIHLVVAQYNEFDVCYQKNGFWDDQSRRCQITTGIQVDVHYPIELIQYPQVDQRVNQFIAGLQQQFLDSYAPDLTLPPPANSWSMSVDYEIFHFSENILSIRLDQYTFTGGAHGNDWATTITVDVAADRDLALNDVFLNGQIPWETLSALTQQSLLEQLGEMADPTWIEQGTGVNPGNYQNWVVTPDALIFYFPSYQVAPYAAGPQRVEIPWVALHTLLAEPFASYLQ